MAEILRSLSSDQSFLKLSRYNVFGALFLAIAFLITIHPSATAKTLNVILDKTSIIKINGNAAIVMVAQPEIASVTVESQRLLFVIGKTTGETNLIVLDSKGNEIVNYDLIVTPESDRHVTIHGGTESLKTLSCAPRCSDVKNPGPSESPGTSGANGAAGADPGQTLKSAEK